MANWTVRAAELAGFRAQYTSVQGVAQRTGATIYYIELFPEAEIEAEGREPVLALMPACIRTTTMRRRASVSRC